VIDLSGKRAVVTGAARGLGLAIAELLAARGASVAIADVDAEGAARAAAALQGAIAVQLDVRDAEAAEAAFAQVADTLGGVEILVNNAGVVRDARLGELEPAEWDAVLDVNLRGYYVCARAALAHLQAAGAAGGARIVNISSRAHLGNPGQANYSAAKAGVIGLTRALSLELGPDGITVNAVAPGMIDTDLVRSHPKADAIVERAVRATPMRRIGQPADVAAAVAFLVSDEAGYVSGEVLHVTGGRY
jgi:3-oxoacyl-[acyl-carrier protein] reductase